MKLKNRTVPLFSLILMAAFTLFLPAVAHAQINYQGRLTDASGAPLPDGQYRIEFTLWDSITGGTPIWGPYTLDGTNGTGKGPLADLVGGRFNVIIGSQDASARSLTDALAAQSAYLQIKVNDEPPISPRQIILPAPRALRADIIPNVTPTATGADITGDLNVSGTTKLIGDVGIGTSTIDASLHVKDANEAQILVESTGANSTGMRAKNTQTEWFAGLDPAGTWTLFETSDGPQNPSLTVTRGGNVGIGVPTPPAALSVNGDIVTSGNIQASSFNGEGQPYVVTLGTKDNTTNWHVVEVPGSTIQQYIGDADGGSIKLLLRVNSTDEVRIINYDFYIEQPSPVSSNVSPGLHGWARQGGSDSSFILDTSARYTILQPWDWIYVANFPRRGRPGLPSGSDGNAYTGTDKYKLSFMTAPNISATVIIYDR
jgi:hypothetical protein